MSVKKKSDPLRKSLRGFSFEKDRLWRITGPSFVAGLTDYNWEITGFAPILTKVFGKECHYGGNAYYLTNEAKRRGYKVEYVEDRA